MKIITFFFTLICFFNLSAQNNIQCKTTNFWQKGRYVINGSLSFTELKNNPETNFWFNPNFDTAQTNSQLIQLLQKNNDLKWIIFVGTWCDDTRAILPEFFKNFTQANLDINNVQLIGVDRNKKTFNKLHKTYKVENVPTFIMFRNNMEVSRIEEYGKDNNFILSLISLLKF